ncbi:MAG: DUF3137 domain-containing protein [Planctomycetes bacterium]|nr:DUF3137 domain-containing protein [Planctomycetota bacterium]
MSEGGFFSWLFGPSREEIWRELAADTGMEFRDGGFWGADTVVAEARGWTVVLDSYTTKSDDGDTTTYTRLRAPFRNAGGIRFKVYRAGLFSGLGKILGLQDLEIGDPEFDRVFVVKGNSPEWIQGVFADPRVRGLLFGQERFTLEARAAQGWFTPEFPAGLEVLSFEVPECVRDAPRLRSFFVLLFAVLERMRALGLADDARGIAAVGA